MKIYRGVITSLIVIILILPMSAAYAAEIVSVKLYFGLSLPTGNAVSLHDWQKFEKNKIATTFDGFNIVSSTGYYKGKQEQSKVVTIIMEKNDIPKAKKLAKVFAKQFHQESVMIVVLPVTEWDFIGVDE